MSQLETIAKGSKTFMVVGKRLGIGIGVALAQLGFEKIDSMRPVASDDFLAAQNLGPLALTLVAIPITLMAKKDGVKTLGADLLTASSTMMTYRIAKIMIPRLSGMRISTRRYQQVNRHTGTHSQSTPAMYSENYLLA